MNRPSVRYRANARFLGDDVRLRFGGSLDAALVYDSANDELTLQTTGASGELVDRLAFQAGTDTPSVVFNDGGFDADFRVEGDSDPDLLFVDAGADAVVFGGSGPDGSEKVKVVGDLRLDGDLDLVGTHEIATTEGSLTLSPASDLILNDGKNFIGDTSNENMTVGLTINQGESDDAILTLKASGVAHGVTNIAETDTWGLFTKVTAANGGLHVRGFQNNWGGGASSVAGLALYGYGNPAGHGNGTAKSTSANGAVLIMGAENDGSASGAGIGANGNVLVVSDVGAGARWLVDAEGDTWQAGDATIAGDLDHNGSNVGFYGTAPASKQAVAGSRGGNAALASLLSALATIGLITDSSTA